MASHLNLLKLQQKINFYRGARVYSFCPRLKQYYDYLMMQEVDNLINLLALESRSDQNRQQREFTLSELATYDGTGGKPAYAAVNGIVYDVSLEPTWGGASHFGLTAGKDLTSQFSGCHGNQAVLSKLNKVGIIKG